MPIVCRNIPNRSKPRPFKESDLRRIAKYVADDGVPWWKILATVAVGAGVGYLLCKLAKSVNNTLSILSIFKQIALITTASTAIRVLIEWLKGGKIIRLPLINRFAIVLIVILVLVQKALDALTNILDDIIFLEEIAEGLNNACDYVGVRIKALKRDGKIDQLSKNDRLLAL